MGSMFPILNSDSKNEFVSFSEKKLYSQKMVDLCGMDSQQQVFLVHHIGTQNTSMEKCI